MIVVSTDGSALGNPNGSMGWAWADHIDESGSSNEHHHTGNADAGGATNGTNQIGELCAVLEALRAHPGNEPLTIESDSQYAINCATTWIHGWKKNGWKNSKNEPVKNAELIRAIDAEITKREGAVKFVWVKGHAGNAGNEKVDTLARGYAEDCRNGLKDGYLPLEGWKSLLASEYAKGTNVPSDAKMLLDGKISNAEYHLERTVGEDINPDFSAQNSKNDSDLTESTNESAREQTQEAACETKSKQEQEETCEQARETKRETLENSEKDALSIENKQDVHQQDAVTIVQEVPKTEQNVTQTASKPVQGLSVSGVLQFTPPPNTSPSFNGEARFISGTINVSGYVEPDGTLHLAPTAFYLSQLFLQFVQRGVWLAGFFAWLCEIGITCLAALRSYTLFGLSGCVVKFSFFSYFLSKIVFVNKIITIVPLLYCSTKQFLSPTTSKTASVLWCGMSAWSGTCSSNDASVL